MAFRPMCFEFLFKVIKTLPGENLNYISVIIFSQFVPLVLRSIYLFILQVELIIFFI